MTLSDILKAAILSRVVGLDPLDACGLAERAALQTKPPNEPAGHPPEGGVVSCQIAEYLSRTARFRTSSPYSRGFTEIGKVEISVSQN